MINNALDYLLGLMAKKVTYSMTSRNGAKSYDCSSSIYYALISAGLLPKSTAIGNTDSLFGDLERNGWKKLPEVNGKIDTKAGDVFIWGRRGASGGAFGHTGQFVNANDVIHCSSYYNGMHINNYDGLAEANGWPEATFYRYVGKTASNVIDQVVEVGSYIKFSKMFTVNDIKLLSGIWQVRTNELCKSGFTWNDNGIPAAAVTEVDSEGYATKDQELAKNSKYKIPGKFKVLDVGQSDSMWLALISFNSLKFWVDLKLATEVSSSDAGTPKPGKKPVTQPKPPVVPVTSPKTDVKPPIIPEKVIELPVQPAKPIIETKEKVMAFDNEQLDKLKIATESAQKVANDVAASDAAKEIVSGVSKKTKLVVYIVGDALVGLGLLVPGAAVVLGWNEINAVVALSSLFATAGAFILTMFGIYKSGK